MKNYITSISEQTNLINIIEHHEGKHISGGPTIAYFYDIKLAEEYCSYKNKTKQEGKPLIIEQGLFIDGKTINATGNGK